MARSSLGATIPVGVEDAERGAAGGVGPGWKGESGWAESDAQGGHDAADGLKGRHSGPTVARPAAYCRAAEPVRALSKLRVWSAIIHFLVGGDDRTSVAPRPMRWAFAGVGVFVELAQPGALGADPAAHFGGVLADTSSEHQHIEASGRGGEEPSSRTMR